MAACPACLPPHNQHCSLCSGTSKVTKSVAEEYVSRRDARMEAMALGNAINTQVLRAGSVEEIKTEVQKILDSWEKWL